MLEEFVGGDPRQQAEITEADLRRTRTTMSEWGFKVGYLGLFGLVAALTLSVQDFPYGIKDIDESLATLNQVLGGGPWAERLQALFAKGDGGLHLLPRLLFLAWIGLTGKLYFPVFAYVNLACVGLLGYALDRYAFERSRPLLLLLTGMLLVVYLRLDDATAPGLHLYLLGGADALALLLLFGSLVLAARVDQTRELWKPFVLATAALLTADFGLLAFVGAPVLFALGKPGWWRKLGLWVAAAGLLCLGLYQLGYTFLPEYLMLRPWFLPASLPHTFQEGALYGLLYLLMLAFILWAVGKGYRSSPVAVVFFGMMPVAAWLFPYGPLITRTTLFAVLQTIGILYVVADTVETMRVGKIRYGIFLPLYLYVLSRVASGLVTFPSAAEERYTTLVACLRKPDHTDYCMPYPYSYDEFEYHKAVLEEARRLGYYDYRQSPKR